MRTSPSISHARAIIVKRSLSLKAPFVLQRYVAYETKHDRANLLRSARCASVQRADVMVWLDTIKTVRDAWDEILRERPSSARGPLTARALDVGSLFLLVWLPTHPKPESGDCAAERARRTRSEKWLARRTAAYTLEATQMGAIHAMRGSASHASEQALL